VLHCPAWPCPSLPFSDPPCTEPCPALCCTASHCCSAQCPGSTPALPCMPSSCTVLGCPVLLVPQIQGIFFQSWRILVIGDPAFDFASLYRTEFLEVGQLILAISGQVQVPHLNTLRQPDAAHPTLPCPALLLPALPYPTMPFTALSFTSRAALHCADAPGPAARPLPCQDESAPDTCCSHFPSAGPNLKALCSEQLDTSTPHSHSSVPLYC